MIEAEALEIERRRLFRFVLYCLALFCSCLYFQQSEVGVREPNYEAGELEGWRGTKMEGQVLHPGVGSRCWIQVQPGTNRATEETVTSLFVAAPTVDHEGDRAGRDTIANLIVHS